MRDILVVCPQERDLRAIDAAGLSSRYRIRYAGSDLDQLAGFDPVAFLEEWEDALIDELSAELDNVAALDVHRVGERDRGLRRHYPKYAAI